MKIDTLYYRTVKANKRAKVARRPPAGFRVGDSVSVGFTIDGEVSHSASLAFPTDPVGQISGNAGLAVPGHTVGGGWSLFGGRGGP